VTLATMMPVDTSRHAVVVFDGECAFCNRWIDFLLRFDRADIFRFTARQSVTGAEFSRQAGLPDGGFGSIIVVEDGRVLLRSTAVLRMLSLLGFPFSLAAAFQVIPAGLRDVGYDFIARNRIRWFGRMQACRLPAPADRHRFL
jgi:predicted DCC family thiol-disulfide oxidoreductase YuxK